ncbi:uncharacterized protein MONBRDRAFT_38698 [Monosiga brevicollis MX1]|uniref:Calmodulin n=1 Tax=Monosiga brevicollis TaxID=81824 RepID=A9V9L8_MONBE|nr:uncharacterized protein MONBRDRAFT_38698 [Monosiga brevicollis MX1]EDQ85691.1 predicted protein [Monosiga brevicollis MX1]|eukprot:XP_001749406.1 hypothetical protein [Monosiga brevicollis MX1]
MENRAMARAKTQGELPSLPTERIIRSGRARRHAQRVRALTIDVAENRELAKQPVHILVNHSIRTFEILLNEITRKLAPKFGAVRRLMTPDGVQIKSLDDLDSNGRYVAVGNQRFRKMPYFEPEAVRIAYTSPDLKSPTKIRRLSRSTTEPAPKVNGYAKPAPQAVASPPEEHKPSPAPVSKPKPKKVAPEVKIQSYNISIETGENDDDGTTGAVYLTLVGSKAKSARTPLREDESNFETGALDVFGLEFPALGDVKQIILEIGSNSSWYCKRVTVRDSVTNKRTFFHVEGTLDEAHPKAIVEGSANEQPPAAKIAVEDDVFDAQHRNADAAVAVDDSDDTREDRPIDDEAAQGVDDEDHDADITVANPALDKLEAEIKAASQNPATLREMWRRLDFNGNNIVSLAEIDKWVKETYPILDSKPAMMRAYKKTTLRDGDGDAWVERKEFPALLVNLFYFNRLFVAFDAIDTDDDRRVDLDEFVRGLKVVGLQMSKADAAQVFEEIDSNDGQYILFDEFAAWAAREACPVNDTVMNEFVGTDERPIDD